jgi:hypothetical protein
MSQHHDNERTELFSVVGAPYVAEHHDDTRSYYRLSADGHTRGTGQAGLWLMFYAVICAVTIFGPGAGKAIGYATALLK